MAEIEVDPKRLQRVHVANVRNVKDKYVVALSGPVEDANGNPIENAETWEVPRDVYQEAVRSGTVHEL